MAEEDYVTVAEAANMLNRSVATVWRLIREHKLETFRRALDRKIYVRKSDIEAVQREFRPAKSKTKAA